MIDPGTHDEAVEKTFTTLKPSRAPGSLFGKVGKIFARRVPPPVATLSEIFGETDGVGDTKDGRRRDGSLVGCLKGCVAFRITGW